MVSGAWGLYPTVCVGVDLMMNKRKRVVCEQGYSINGHKK